MLTGGDTGRSTVNSKRIEAKGVNAIELFALNSHYLMPHIRFNDRTDSWDGNIFVYNEKSGRKSTLAGKVPIQVKATEVRAFSCDQAKQVMEVVDLCNYKVDGGIVIFHVELLGMESNKLSNKVL